MKSEPDCYSIDDLQKQKVGHWDGVRNYQARNFMRDDMKVGDMVLFYHSNQNPPAVAGIARVVREGYPDHTAEDKLGEYFDLGHTKGKPRWFMVDVEFVEKFKNEVTLDQIKFNPKLVGIIVAQRGSRLSVQPVSKKHFDEIVKMGR